MFLRHLALHLCLAALTTSLASAERLSPERLWDMKRIGDSAVSPDGAHVAYLVTQYDLGENKGTTSLLLQELPKDLSTNTKALAFQSDLIRSEAKVLLSDVKGLHSLNWLNHSTGPKLVYIAPAEMEVPASEESEETAEEDAEPETVEKPQAWLLSPEGGDPVQLTSVEEGINLISNPFLQKIHSRIPLAVNVSFFGFFKTKSPAPNRVRIHAVSYTHLTLPTTPYV